MACVLYEMLTDQNAFVRPADGYASFEELHKLVLRRQRQWVSSFSATEYCVGVIQSTHSLCAAAAGSDADLLAAVFGACCAVP